MTLEKEFQLVLMWFAEGRVFHKQSDEAQMLLRKSQGSFPKAGFLACLSADITSFLHLTFCPTITTINSKLKGFLQN